MKKFFLPVICLVTGCLTNANAQTRWDYLSTTNGKIPMPWSATQQTSSLPVDINNDGLTDWVVTCRKAPISIIALVQTRTGLKRYVLEDSSFTIEAGGTAYDIDGDGDQDIVFGGDYESHQMWWWENPYPRLSPGISWKRHMILSGGAVQHHDQLFGDFKQTGKAQLAFWNQGCNTLFLAEIPDDPKMISDWKKEVVYSGKGGSGHGWYPEGLAAADVDGDGYTDLLAGNYWFKKQPDGSFIPIRIGKIGGRIAAGKFKAGKTMQVVIAPGDGTGPLMWYECTGDPTDSASWIGHDLAGRDLIHGHSLFVADIDGDGNLDIFAAEMEKWTESKAEPNNPNAQAFIFYGDGKGHFRKEIFKTGFGFHETKLADIDGDGDLDILSKPYNCEAPRLDIWLQNGTGKRLPPIHEALKNKTGLELYSVRREIKKELPASFRKIRSMGIRTVEVSGFYGWKPADFKKQLDMAGLTPTSMLFPGEMFKDSLAEIIKLCKLFGVRQVGTSDLPHGKIFTRQDALDGAAFFNRTGTALKEAGLHFFYHPHGFEFVPSAEGTLFDVLAVAMKAGVADFQLDVFWALRGGADPAELLRKYPGRFISLHLKDPAYGTATSNYSGAAPEVSSVVLGKGQADLKAVLDAAILTGVKQYFIEDEHPDAMNQVPRSLKYLSRLR